MKIKSIKSVVVGLLAVPVLVFGLMSSAPFLSPVSAYVCKDGLTVQNGADCAQPENVPSCLFGKDCAFTQITNTALYVIGAISVLMLIYGGIRYTTSGGNEKNVVAAKNTIMYAIIGVVVAVMAYAIVNFVLGTLTGL